MYLCYLLTITSKATNSILCCLQSVNILYHSIIATAVQHPHSIKVLFIFEKCLFRSKLLTTLFYTKLNYENHLLNDRLSFPFILHF